MVLNRSLRSSLFTSWLQLFLIKINNILLYCYRIVLIDFIKPALGAEEVKGKE
jgi:hypothetical protein